MPETLAEQLAAHDLGQLVTLPLDRLRIAPWNARKTYDPASIEELAASIREHGIQSPLLVRPVPSADEQHSACEIVAGHRRFKAADRVGLPAAPCLVRELGDDEAREIGLVDNLQREDVPALEEAEAYEQLRQRLGTAAAIAQRVGKDVGYVARRLQLIQLAEQPRRALAERLITIDHALLLARLGEAEQDQNLKWALNPNEGPKKPVSEVIDYRLKERGDRLRYSWNEPQSVLNLKLHIEQHVGRRLARAPWDLDDATLTAAGPCAGCASNTGDNTALFSDLAIEEATCENGVCFEAKRAAFVSLRSLSAINSVAGVQLPALKLSWKDSTAAPRLKDGDIVLNQTFRHGQWVEAKKGSCDHVLSGVTVNWSDDNHHGFGRASGKLRKPGEILTVCVQPKCKAHPKVWERKKSSPSRNDPAAQQADAERRQKAKAAAIAESKLRIAVATEALEKVAKLPEAALRAVLASFRADRAVSALVPGLAKILAGKPLDDPQFARAVCALSLDQLECWASEWNSSPPNAGRKEFLASLQRIGYDGSRHWQKPKPEKKAKAEGYPAKKGQRSPRAVLSPESRARIVAAQKLRWAAAKTAPAKKGSAQ